MSDTQRNFLILIAIALVGLVATDAFGITASLISLVIRIGFFLAIIAALVMLYRSRSGTIALMPATPRLVLQASGLIIIVVVATGSFRIPFVPVLGWGANGGTPTIAFWTLIALGGFGLFWSWNQRTTGW